MMRDQLKKLNPNMFSIPGDTEIKKYISSLNQTQKKVGILRQRLRKKKSAPNKKKIGIVFYLLIYIMFICVSSRYIF